METAKQETPRFVELSTTNFEEVIINTALVQKITINREGDCVLWFGSDDNVTVLEPYESVKHRLGMRSKFSKVKTV